MEASYGQPAMFEANEVAVGFDLDMTLVDSRPVSRPVLETLASRYHLDLDVDGLMEAYGLPLARWLPVGADLRLFRHLQLREAAKAVPMPGARDAVRAVRREGGRVVVITAGQAEVAIRVLRAAGIVPDALRTDAWGVEKVTPLRAEKCWAFVGDHADDMIAAHQAGAIAIGVATGTTPPAGADVTLRSLREFPDWFAEHWRAGVRRRSS
jgi:phosphoglycolate phosphatase-like HAD superfamily hydrolase